MRNMNVTVLSVITFAFAAAFCVDAMGQETGAGRGGINGYVFDAKDKSPVQDAQITVSKSSAPVATPPFLPQTSRPSSQPGAADAGKVTATTGKDGTFVVRGLKGGVYAISVDIAGKVSHSKLSVFDGYATSFVAPLGIQPAGTSDEAETATCRYPSLDIGKILDMPEANDNPYKDNLRGLKDFIKNSRIKPDPAATERYYASLKDAKKLPLVISPTDMVIILKDDYPALLKIGFRASIGVRFMHEVEGTGLWMYWLRIPNDTILRYSIWSRSGGWQGDPANPWQQHQNYMGEKGFSWLTMPGPNLLWAWDYNDKIKHGKTDTAVLKNELGYEKRIHIYTPPDYRTDGEPYKTIYHNDGQMIVAMPIANLLDNLIAAGYLPPIVFVCIEGSPDRDLEYCDAITYPANERAAWTKKVEKMVADKGLPAYYTNLPHVYGEMIKNQIIPYVESHYNVGKDRMDRAMGGGSFAGTYTCYYANAFPDVIGNFWPQSASEFLWMSWKDMPCTIKMCVCAGYFDLRGTDLTGRLDEYCASAAKVFKDTKVDCLVKPYSGGHEKGSRMPEIVGAVKFFWPKLTAATQPATQPAK